MSAAVEPGWPTFKCGHPATPDNSQSTGSVNPPRCRICYRAYMARYMRETGRNANWRYGPYLSKNGPALPILQQGEGADQLDRLHVQRCLEQGGFRRNARHPDGHWVTVTP